MKKRVVLSIVITGVIVGLTSQYWLIRKPVIVSFDAVGQGQTTFEAVLNKKDDDNFSRNNKGKVEINLDAASEITIPVYKAKHPKRFQIIVRQDFSEKGGGLLLSNIRVDNQLLDLSEFYANSCKIKIENNSIYINDVNSFSQLFSKERLNVKPKLIFDIRILTIILIISYLLAYKITSYAADFKSVENKSRIEVFFLAAFFFILIIPSLKINDGVYDKLENRKLSEYKPFLTKNEINYSFGQDFNSWYSDRFLGRPAFINLYNKLRFFLTYYIYEQNGYYYNKKTKWSFSTGWFPKENNIDFSMYEKNLKKLNDFCKKNGIKLYIVIAPVKCEIYPEAIYPYKNRISNGEKFKNYINTSFNKEIVTYPLKEMQTASNNEFTYPKGDVHWSEYGALIAYKNLMQIIKQDFPDIHILNNSDFVITKNKLARTDYPSTLFHKGHEYKVMDISINKSSTSYLSYESKFADKLNIINQNSTAASDSYFPYGNPQKAYIIGTSFCENIHLFLKYTFKEVKKRRINNSVELPKFKMSRWEKEILKFKPDILIIVIQSISIDNFKNLYSEED